MEKKGFESVGLRAEIIKKAMKHLPEGMKKADWLGKLIELGMKRRGIWE